MIRTILRSAALLLMLLAVSALRAGETWLTYPQALDRAVRVDERLLMSDADREALAAGRRENASRVRPRLDLATNLITNNSAIDVQFGGPGGMPRTIQDTLQGDARLEARWDFYQPGHGREQDALEEDIEALGAEKHSVEAIVRYEAAGAYLDVLEASARRRVAAADLERAGVQFSLGRERLAAGEGSTLGVRQLELAVRSLSAALDGARANEDLARERLRHLLDLDTLPEIPPAGEAALPGRPGLLAPEALVASAREGRSEIEAARRRVSSARDRVAAAAARLRPEAGATGSVAASTVEGFDGKTVDTRMQVGLRWSFFDAGARRAATDVESERLRRTELELAALTRRVETEVRQSFQRLRMALMEEERASSRRDQAAAAIDQTQALYEAGAASEMDLSERRADLAAASALLEAARVERVRSFVTLRFAVGAQIPEAS